jgi:selenocysteine lyase/cysteine desulfurase
LSPAGQGVEDKGGMLRGGLTHYNTREAVDRLIDTITVTAWRSPAGQGVADKGGMVRVGLTHSNTREEVDRLIDAIIELTA